MSHKAGLSPASARPQYFDLPADVRPGGLAANRIPVRSGYAPTTPKSMVRSHIFVPDSRGNHHHIARLHDKILPLFSAEPNSG